MSTALETPDLVRASAKAPARPPLWFDRLSLGVASAVLAIGLSALLLGALGVLHPLTVVPVSVALFALSTPVQRSLRPAARSVSSTRVQRQEGQVAAALAVVVCVAAGIWASVLPGTPVLVDRDPASYATTAKWLANGNGLRIDRPLEAFGDNPGLQAESTAVFEVGDSLEFQFLHLPAAAAAGVAAVVGDRAIFLTSGVVASLCLLAVYALAVRVTRRPLLALAAPCALAVSMPFVAVSRDVFSEPYALVFLWTALWLACEVLERPGDLRLARAAGVFAGATVLVRVDGILFLVLLAVACTAWVVAARPDEDHACRARAVKAASVTSAVMLLVALADLFAYSGTYARILGTQILALLALLAFTISCCGVAIARATWVRRLATRLQGRRHQAALLCASLVAVALLSLWFLRPALAHTPVVESLEADTDAWAFQWMSWYLGPPTVALAVAGTVAASFRFVRGTLQPTLVPVLAVMLGTGALYWWDPNILPDHIWATRRFLPAVLPGLAVMACVAVAWLLDRVARPRTRELLSVLAFAAIVVPAGAPTTKAPLMARQTDVVQVLREACALLPGDAAVLVLGGTDRDVLPQALRSWCGVPVATVREESGLIGSRELGALASEVAGRGRRLHVVSSDSDLVVRTVGDQAAAAETAAITSPRRLEVAFDRVPSRYMTDDEYLRLRARFSLTVAPVEPPR